MLPFAQQGCFLEKREAVAKEAEDPTKSSWNWGKTLHDGVEFTYQDKLRVIPTHLYDWGACMPSYILHCSSSRSLDRHNKLQCNKTKVQTSAGYPQETNALNTVFCTVEYRSKKHFHTPHPKQSCNNQISSGAVANPRNPRSNKLCSRGVDAIELTPYFKTPSTP